MIFIGNVFSSNGTEKKTYKSIGKWSFWRVFFMIDSSVLFTMFGKDKFCLPKKDSDIFWAYLWGRVFHISMTEK